ncbi:uncharacterized protein SCHCODRAFT_02626527 [Schizophyllum commune H4-8]|uniref:uncharacterized protein n=1 Tax=Schizophyllum commune (strain H4-8 / FGSC 9210) TaxID=578458 RepID=UPI00215FFF21|nr:uncharacterized protein SCHCODRAFT_02626527 [Schizophyllum commune H4-8]KAI5892583.1 hypothetical protein SCHCODRAFT_02626527 [Schizophyllum commune H4-8]
MGGTSGLHVLKLFQSRKAVSPGSSGGKRKARRSCGGWKKSFEGATRAERAHGPILFGVQVLTSARR